MNKDQYIQIRATKKEKADLREWADAAGTKVSKYMLDAARQRRQVEQAKEGPTSGDVAAMALKIYNAEGISMARARKEATLRLTMAA